MTTNRAFRRKILSAVRRKDIVTLNKFDLTNNQIQEIVKDKPLEKIRRKKTAIGFGVN